MTRRLNTILGYYTPAFFHINVGTNTSFEKFSDKDFAVFVHEYIHFIQDVTTIYGLNNMYVYSEYIRYATNKVYKSTEKEFEIPIYPTPDNESNIYLNKIICNITNGDSQEIKKIKKISKIETIQESTEVLNSSVESLESVLVTLQDDFDIEHQLFLGALSLMESMAYLLEQMICPGYVKSPDFPYSFAEKIVDEIYPEFGKDRLNTLALCDLCLQYSNPGAIFIQFLQEMDSKKWIPKNPEEIYDEFLKREVTLNRHGQISLERNFKILSDVVNTQIKEYFKDPKIFQDIRNWVDQLMDTAFKIRFRNRYFVIDLARGGEVKKNVAFKKIREQLGTPLISNKSGDCTLLYPNKPDGVEIGYFSAIGEIISLFENGNCECSLYAICVKYGNKTDNRCKTAPWRRSQDDLLCPYALLWNHWKLREFIPKTK